MGHLSEYPGERGDRSALRGTVKSLASSEPLHIEGELGCRCEIDHKSKTKERLDFEECSTLHYKGLFGIL